MCPFYTFPSNVSKIFFYRPSFNPCFFKATQFLQVFPLKPCMRLSSRCAPHTPRSVLPLLLDHPYDIFQWVNLKVVKILISIPIRHLPNYTNPKRASLSYTLLPECQLRILQTKTSLPRQTTDDWWQYKTAAVRMAAMAVCKSSLLVYIIGYILLIWTHCSCTDLLTHVLNCRPTYTLIQTMGLQPFYGKGRHWVLRGSWQASHGQVAVSGMPNRLNHCLICIIHT